jgi:hypothetical protein
MKETLKSFNSWLADEKAKESSLYDCWETTCNTFGEQKARYFLSTIDFPVLHTHQVWCEVLTQIMIDCVHDFQDNKRTKQSIVPAKSNVVPFKPKI